MPKRELWEGLAQLPGSVNCTAVFKKPLAHRLFSYKIDQMECALLRLRGQNSFPCGGIRSLGI